MSSIPRPECPCPRPPCAAADDAVRRETNRKLADAAMRAFDAETSGAPQRPYAIAATFASEPRRQLRLLYHADRPFDTRRTEATLRRRFGADVVLRQAGIRDEVAALGSIGPCGRPVCCACALTPAGASGVNLRMAKRQNVALNPVSLNGQCDRLKCCLGFEDDGDEPTSPEGPAPSGGAPTA